MKYVNHQAKPHFLMVNRKTSEVGLGESFRCMGQTVKRAPELHFLVIGIQDISSHKIEHGCDRREAYLLSNLS